MKTENIYTYQISIIHYKDKKQQIILINSYLEMFYFIMCTLIVKYSVKSCYCCLFYVIGLSGPAHPLKVKYSVSKLIVACSMYWPFRTSTPSQSEIFCLKAVIVAIGLSGPAHPSQSEIFCLKALIVDLREYFTLGGCAGPERPIATITALRQNILLWEGVLVLKEVNYQKDVNCQIIKYLDYGGGSQKK